MPDAAHSDLEEGAPKLDLYSKPSLKKRRGSDFFSWEIMTYLRNFLSFQPRRKVSGNQELVRRWGKGKKSPKLC